MTSFCMQFKKVGSGLLREAKRRREGEWAVLAKAKGDNHETLWNSEGFGVRGFFPSGYLHATNGG